MWGGIVTSIDVPSPRSPHETSHPADRGGRGGASPTYGACESGHLLNDLLRGELGFVTSDSGGTHSTVASANNGMDQEMNGSDFYGTALATALAHGQVSQAGRCCRPPPRCDRSRSSETRRGRTR